MRFLVSFTLLFLTVCSANAETGFHATLKVDFAVYWTGRLDGWEALLKERLNRAHATFSELKSEDARLSVHIPDAANRAAAKMLLARRIGLAGGFVVEEVGHDLVVSPEPGYRDQTERDLLDRTARVIERRVSLVTDRHARVQVKAPDTIDVAVPDLADRTIVDKLFGPPMSLDFYLVDEDASAKPTAPPPTDDIVLPFDNRASQPEALAVHATPFMSGERIVEAQSGFDQTMGEPIILLRFDEAGTEIFARVTHENTLHRIAIAVDGRIVCAPMINEEIAGGRLQINGVFTPDQAIELAMRLSPSGLPAPVRVVESGVGPLP